jgi:hypothetical protein
MIAQPKKVDRDFIGLPRFRRFLSSMRLFYNKSILYLYFATIRSWRCTILKEKKQCDGRGTA